MNQLTVVVIIGFVIVGSIAAFSVFLQQDNASAVIERVINPNYHCLEDYNDLYYPINNNLQSKLSEGEKFSKLIKDRCFDSFRDWMPESHQGWDQMIVRENNLIENCELYLKGELVLTEREKPIWKEKGCKDFLKQFD